MRQHTTNKLNKQFFKLRNRCLCSYYRNSIRSQSVHSWHRHEKWQHGPECRTSHKRRQHASRTQTDFTPPPLTARLQFNSTALLTLLRCEFWAVFTRLGSAVRVATLYYFDVTFKRAIDDGYFCHGPLYLTKQLTTWYIIFIERMAVLYLFKE
jgi:hypothetical protein